MLSLYYWHEGTRYLPSENDCQCADRRMQRLQATGLIIAIKKVTYKSRERSVNIIVCGKCRRPPLSHYCFCCRPLHDQLFRGHVADLVLDFDDVNKKRCHVCGSLTLFEVHYAPLFAALCPFRHSSRSKKKTQQVVPEDDDDLPFLLPQENVPELILPAANLNAVAIQQPPPQRLPYRRLGFSGLERSREFGRMADNLNNSFSDAAHAFRQSIAIFDRFLEDERERMLEGFKRPPEAMKKWINVQCGFPWTVVTDACIKWNNKKTKVMFFQIQIFDL